MDQQIITPTVKPARTLLVCAAPQLAGRCNACHASIVWVYTKRYARHPLNEGFDVIEEIEEHEEVNERLNRIRKLQRVSSAFSHFATCPFADRFKKKRREL